MIFRPFQKILIANRGEISCRVARTAKAMGYRTVAVFSDADACALHVRMADEAVRIGLPSPQDSYLNIWAILEAARKTGADAIHPGYGFLAENADFAEACQDAEIVFIGPPGDVIRRMGDKAAAKAIMQNAGVPCVPGYCGHNQSGKRFAAEAGRLGFPLLIKAIGGGGGRGIRAVHGPANSAPSLRRRGERRRARSAMTGSCWSGWSSIRAISKFRFSAMFTAISSTFSSAIARRSGGGKKIIEEAPSPVLSPGSREKLTGYAVERRARLDTGTRGPWSSSRTLI